MSVCALDEGDVSIDCRARHELKMLPRVVWLGAGGLAGGEAKSDACRRVTLACDESQERAEGINMVVMVVVCDRCDRGLF